MEEYKGRWITFRFKSLSESKKTAIWEVVNTEQDFVLGIIKWNPGWRKYSFYPDYDTTYEEDCLNDIASFIKLRTENHKNGKEI